MKRKVVTKQIKAVSDSGENTLILEYTTQTLYRPLSGAEQWLDGSRSYASSTGEPFNPMPDGSFEHVISEEVFRPI